MECRYDNPTASRCHNPHSSAQQPGRQVKVGEIRCQHLIAWQVWLPAVLDCFLGCQVIPPDQAPGPVQVEAVQPVVVDAERVFQVFHSMVPAAGNKDGLASLLQH